MKKNNSWVLGNLIANEDSTFIIEPVEDSHLEYCLDCAVPFDVDLLYEVRPETIGQDTGLRCKNGEKIYEGDILEKSYIKPMTGKKISDKYIVACENGCFIAQRCLNHPDGTIFLYFGTTFLYFLTTKNTCEVIGNIYDNLELLEANK